MNESQSADDRFLRAAEILGELTARGSSGDESAFEAAARAHPDLRFELAALRGELLEIEQSLDSSRQDFEAAKARTDQMLAQLRSNAADRYVVEGELGRGGMGAVFRVRDTKLDRPLAYKVILGQVTAASSGATPPVDQLRLRRFIDEARMTSRLDHPGIVPVHEVGVDPDGRVFFTMKLVKGRNLAEIMARRASDGDDWSTTRLLRILRRVCDAVGYAHDRGVIHRDLKPANIMVGDFGEVYVMDWGLARELADKKPNADAARREERLRDEADVVDGGEGGTKPGGIVGTPAYMSPEQASASRDLGLATDVYSIGAILYELLRGYRPYASSGDQPNALVVLERIRAGPPVPLTPEDGSPDLVAITNKAIAREPDERYASARDLGDDLDRYLEGRVVVASGASSWAAAAKWVRRNRALATSWFVLAAVLLTTTVVSLVYKFRADRNALLLQSQLETTRDINEDLIVERQRVAQEAERAQRSEKEVARRAEEGERAKEAIQATLKDVLSLSMVKKLDELEGDAARMWPAHPDLIPKYKEWISHARRILECAECGDQDLGSPGGVPMSLEIKLQELRSSGTIGPLDDPRERQNANSWINGSNVMRADLEWRRRMLGLHPWPDEDSIWPWSELDAAKPALKILGMGGGTMFPNGPRRWSHKSDLKRVLFYSQKAFEAAQGEERALMRFEYASALLDCGQFDLAREHAQQVDEEAVGVNAVALRRSAERVLRDVEYWTSSEGLEQERSEFVRRGRRAHDALVLGQTKVNLETDDPQSGWWHDTLQDLVAHLRLFTIESSGSSGLFSWGESGQHGWGMFKRLEFAESVEHRSISGPDAQARWKDALGSIERSERYGSVSWPSGNRLRPQMGLVPLGVDARSGLWEFWHLQSGEEPKRGEAGTLEIDEDSGIILVLLPGGKVTLGSQNTDPTGANYDPGWSKDEVVHEVVLAPFFVSKYEMTQSQWNRFCGSTTSENRLGQIAGGEIITGLNPAESMTWVQALWMGVWMGLALPTEDQWEYACRGGTTTPFWTGETRESLRGVSNIADRTAAKQHGPDWTGLADWPEFEDGRFMHMAVDLTHPNPYGLHGIHDNVSEWVADDYSTAYSPIGGDRKVWRGGNVYSVAKYCRSARRTYSSSTNRYYNLGVRYVRQVDP